MKILFTGGGSGGHFYPIIAVAEAIKEVAREKKLIQPDLYYLAPEPYNEQKLFDHQITYYQIPAGKYRRYFSLLNFIDIFKTAFGVLKALWRVFWIYPDIVFAKGGFGSFPTLMAAKILRIPVIIHESDSSPGKVNLWASKFAEKIAISYPDFENNFDPKKTAWTGNPIRKEITYISKEGAHEFLDFERTIPTIMIIGGSQGSEIINNAVIDSLSRLIENFQIIHQIGKNNFKKIKDTADLILMDSPYKNRYKPYAFLDDLAMKMSAGACDLIISRAGSTIFEIANWKKPSILIPITNSNGNHQRKNAYNYARSGATVVIEEANLSDDIIVSEIERILSNPEIFQEMKRGAQEFSKPEASRTIADEILELALKHEK